MLFQELGDRPRGTGETAALPSVSLTRVTVAPLLCLCEATAFFSLFMGTLELTQPLFACGSRSERPGLVQLVALSGNASLSAQVFEVIGGHVVAGCR